MDFIRIAITVLLLYLPPLVPSPNDELKGMKVSGAVEERLNIDTVRNISKITLTDRLRSVHLSFNHSFTSTGAFL